MEIIDHRSIKTDIPLGGATRAFELKSNSKPGFLARVIDVTGNGAEIEALYDKDTLFRVSREEIEVSYDFGGNLTRLRVDLVRAYAALSPSILAAMDPETLVALDHLEQFGSKLTMEINLCGGLALGDMGGWCRMVAGGSLERASDGVGGWAIGPGRRSVIYPIAINKDGGEPIGAIYLTVGLVDGLLKIGLGDKFFAYMTKFRRLVDPEKLTLARTPEGVLNLLSSLVEL